MSTFVSALGSAKSGNMKISFILNNSDRKVSAIIAKLSYSGNKYSYPTGESVRTEFWKNQRCRGCDEAGAINNKLEAVEAACKNAILYFKKDFKIPSNAEFRKKVDLFLLGNNDIDIKRRDKSFVLYIEEYIPVCGKSAQTKKVYGTTLNMLKKYQEDKRVELSFSDITLKFASDFNRYLINKSYSRNTIGSHFKQIKVFMRVAHEIDKLHDNMDYQQFKVDSETADTIYLREDELLKIHNLVIDENLVRSACKDNKRNNILSKIKALNIIKNKFLIGAYTALRVSNFNQIQEYNIGNEVITILPKKGSSLRKPQPIKIPMHRVVKEILANGFDPSIKVSDQKINKHIKEICKFANINDKVVLYRTEGGVVVERVYEKWEVVTTHTARRSAATNLYKAGVPRKSIMMLTGHKTEAQFEQYIKLTAEENAEILMKHSFFRVADAISIDAVNVGWLTKQMEKERLNVSDLSNRMRVDSRDIERIFETGEMSAWQRAALYYLFVVNRINC